MILSDIAKVIDGSPPGLQGSTIVDERLLTLRELGVLFGMSEAKLRRLVARGDLPAVRVGEEDRFSLRAIERHLTNTVGRRFHGEM
jgi:excisionase family DNA binding protein